MVVRKKLQGKKVKTEKDCCCRNIDGHPLWVKHKQDWVRGFIFLLP